MKPRLCLPVLLFLVLPQLAVADPRLPDSTPTGILIDRVLPLAHLEDLDGSPGAPACGLARWRQVVHELERSAERDLGWLAPRQMQRAAWDRFEAADIPLALLHARYDRLDESGRPVTAEVFALTALRDRIYHGGAARFVLAAGQIMAHGMDLPRHLTLDPDDGGGPRELVLDTPLAVAYAATGVKHPVLRAAWDDGRTLTATTTLHVVRLATPDPHETWAVTATELYDGVAGTGQAYIYLAPGHGVLTNPAVVVEGFDLDDTMDWPVLYDLLNRENLLEDLRAEGFDAVVLDFTEATAPIQRNAFVLVELLGQVEAVLQPGRTTALVGASMGGLVGRYALVWLEQQGSGHRVRTFVSFDAPHLGANIPLGVQHWLAFFQANSESAAFLLSRLNSPAARQLLLYHHESTVGTTAAADPLFAAFQAELAALGDWPSQPRLVAVANGSGAGVDQGFAPADQLVRYEYRSLIVDIDGNVWAMPDGGAGIVFEGLIDQIWPLPDSAETVTISGARPWDSAPGGFRGSLAQMDTTAVPYGDIVALHDSHCFIPTVSALALVGAEPFHDIAGDPALMDLTVCDQVYYPETNQEHIAITPANKVWLMAEIGAGVSAVDEIPAAVGSAVTFAPPAPNPFNPRTTLAFRLPDRTAVGLRVYDLSGRVVRNLITGSVYGPGHHEVVWNGADDAGRPLASGTYVCRLDAGDALATRRVTLLK